MCLYCILYTACTCNADVKKQTKPASDASKSLMTSRRGISFQTTQSVVTMEGYRIAMQVSLDPERITTFIRIEQRVLSGRKGSHFARHVPSVRVTCTSNAPGYKVGLFQLRGCGFWPSRPRGSSHHPKQNSRRHECLELLGNFQPNGATASYGGISRGFVKSLVQILSLHQYTYMYAISSPKIYC